jgi:hypothetical protein
LLAIRKAKKVESGKETGRGNFKEKVLSQSDKTFNEQPIKAVSVTPKPKVNTLSSTPARVEPERFYHFVIKPFQWNPARVEPDSTLSFCDKLVLAFSLTLPPPGWGPGHNGSPD